MRPPSEYSSTRRISWFPPRRGSRNTSIVSLSSGGQSSRKTSRKESSISFPSIIETDTETDVGDIGNRNAAFDGHLPPAPPPILGPISHLQERQGNPSEGVQVVDVNTKGDSQNNNIFVNINNTNQNNAIDTESSSFGLSNPTYQSSEVQ